MKTDQPILVTGATGYVGGRLIPRLLAAGYRVRAMGRNLDKLSCRPWAHAAGVSLAAGDMLDAASVIAAGRGCRAACYLVHGMVAQHDHYAEADRQAALNMRGAAQHHQMEQIVYLGGLGDASHPKLSHHLASRHEVGRILQSGPVPTTVLQAAMIIGSGSASFEILRYLVERLPVMITPRWVHTPTQPIAIANVLDYLVGCLQNPATRGDTFDIGGPDVLAYADLIRIYAEEAGLPRRRVIPVPLLTPRLSARWIHLVTPVPAAIALPLTEGLSVPTTCSDHRIRDLVPIDLIDCRQAMRRALDRILEKQVETCWSDAGHLQPPEWAYCGDAAYAGGTLFQLGYHIDLDLPPEKVWPVVARIGGDTGYYFGKPLWRLRGRLDRWAGGVGLRRGRRHPETIGVGDALDFWRVLVLERGRRMTLLPEMRMPGEALLDMQTQPIGPGRSRLSLLARFRPHGLAGIFYWILLYPFHVWLYQGMLKAMARSAGALQTGPVRPMDSRSVMACALPRSVPAQAPTAQSDTTDH